MDTRTKEAVRYLGYGNHAVDGQTLELIRDSFEELDRVADKRIIYRIFDVNVTENESLDIGKLHITSRIYQRICVVVRKRLCWERPSESVLISCLDVIRLQICRERW